MTREVRAVDEFGVIRYRGTEFALGWEMARRKVFIGGRDRNDLVVMTAEGEICAPAIGLAPWTERRLRAEGVR